MASNVALSENNRKNAVVKETLSRDKTSRKKGLHVRKKGYIARLEKNFIVVRRRKRKEVIYCLLLRNYSSVLPAGNPHKTLP